MLGALPVAAEQQKVVLAAQIAGGAHRLELLREVQNFKLQNPEIDLELKMFRGNTYSEKVEHWLHGGAGPDIIYWYGGQRVRQYAEQGLIQNIDSFWKSQNFDDVFTVVASDAVKVDAKAYAIPTVVHFWALYYSPNTFIRHKVSIPTTWSELLESCRTFRAKGVDLFAFGAGTQWTTHAWFDYLTLRLHGLDFYRQLTQGELPYTDKRVLETLSYWRELLDNNCFTKNARKYDLDSALPRMFHGLSATMLTFGRLETSVPSPILEELDVMPFPVINRELPSYTVSPIDVYMVPSYAKLNSGVEKVLAFLGSKEYQAAENKLAARNPARKDVEGASSELSRKVSKMIKASPGGVQYFDREVPIELGSKTPAIFVSFMEHRDIERCARELEAARATAVKSGAYQ